MTVELVPEQRGNRAEIREFAPRELFLEEFSGFVDNLVLAEAVLAEGDPRKNRQFVEIIRRKLESLNLLFTPEEKELFETVFDLFSIKHTLPPHLSETCEFLRGEGNQELSIEIGGPIAVGKTTLGRFMAGQIGAESYKEQFQPAANPFWELAYKDSDFMLRSQLNFLFSGIETGLRAKYQKGRWERDASPWSDILVFMEWRRRAGIVTKEEHQTYMRLVDFLESLISKPNLLIVLKPNSLDRLWEGLQARIEAEPKVRQMERTVTTNDLEIVCQATEDAIEIFKKQYGIEVMVIEVDPVEVYFNPDLKYATIYAIREKLGILAELLIKDPQEVADRIIGIFASNREPQAVVVHSQSMFTGKTSALNFVAEKVGPEKVVTFQPLAAIRYGEKHLNHMIDRDWRMIPAITIESDCLADIIKIIDDDEKEISSEEYPFVFIDDIMLFIGSSSAEAIKVIEKLRQKGFCVVVDGIDYTFQELPFTFMHELIAEALRHPNWHQIEMGTRCKYCGKVARGTRRLKPDGSVAHFTDQAFEAGEHYEPVCCENHPSCIDQPEDFIRQSLPVGD